jgi:hypothetical protein
MKPLIWIGFPFRVLLGLGVLFVVAIFEPNNLSGAAREWGWIWMKTGREDRGRRMI